MNNAERLALQEQANALVAQASGFRLGAKGWVLFRLLVKEQRWQTGEEALGVVFETHDEACEALRTLARRLP